MVGVAAPHRVPPFDAASAPLAIALSPPTASAPVRAPTASVRALASPSPAAAARGGGAALARTMAAPAPARAPSVRPSVAPAAGRPARSLTPAQALDLPPPTPPPVLKTPPPAMVMALGTDSDSEPTHVKPPTAQPAEASEPVLVFPEPEPIIDSITMTGEAEPSVPAAAFAPTPLAPIGAPRRGLALLGIGMGVAIVAVAVIGVKLLRRPKATPSGPVTAEVVTSVPGIEPVAPSLDVPTPAQPAPARVTDGMAMRKTVARKATAKADANRDAPVTAKHDNAASERRHRSHETKPHHGGAHHARKVARLDGAAKASAPAVAVNHADSRPLYEKGNTLLFSGDAKGAIAAYREAVHQAPSDPIGFRGLGLAYELQGETVPAIKAFRRYLKLAPDAPDRAIIHRRIDRLRAKK